MRIYTVCINFLLLLVPVMPFSYPCIPVMGFGFIRDPKNFTGRLIASVDFCVEIFVIVYPEKYVHEANNQLLFPDVYKQWLGNSHIKHMKFVPMDSPVIGVAEGWNLIIKSAQAPWYLITAYDVEFFSGQLEAFSRRFWVDSGQVSSTPDDRTPAKFNFVHTKWQNLPGGRGFNLFGIARDVIDYCGYFDENIYPAFWEDRDYQFRMSLWPGAKVGTYRQIRPWHGERFTVPLLDSKLMTPESFKSQFNYTSGTVYLGPQWHAVMQAATAWNVNYVVSKWGCDMYLAKTRHHLLNCKYSTPFNKGGPLSYWKRDDVRINALQQKYSVYTS